MVGSLGRITTLFGAWLLLALLVPVPAHAYKLIEDTADKHEGARVLILPFVFSTEASGFNYGAGGGISGWPQKQAIVGGAAWKSPEGTDAIYLNLTDFQLPFAKRFFVTVHGMESSYNNMMSYASGVGSNDPASNDSARDDYYQGHGWDQWVEGEVSYVLPMGPHGDEPIHTYTTKRGLLTDGSLYDGEYDPTTSGRSYIKFKPFYRKRWYQDVNVPNSSVETAGIRLTWEYDNTDFWYAPSEGSKTLVRMYQGLATGSTDHWTSLELDFSSFWAQGEDEWFKKRVMGVNLWAVDTPSWDTRNDGTVSGDSPYYMGAALGGYTRQRGYPFYRFHDKAAWNVAVEYRLTPRWSFLDGYKWFKWWEIVPFAEAGRVAPYFNSDAFVKDLKYTGGVGFRTMILNSIVRFDVAASKDGANVWAMVNQTF